MTPEQEMKIREIARDEFGKSVGSMQYTTLNVPRHIHNGSDSPRVSSFDIPEFSTLSTNATGVLGPLNNYGNGSGVISSAGNTNVYTLPVITFGASNDFSGGNAPDGTVIFASGGAELTTNLWVRNDGKWWGFQCVTSFTG